MTKAVAAGVTTCATATPTITASIALISTQVVASNPARKGLVIYNNSANSVYLTYGPVSTSNACTRILTTFAQWDMPSPIYTGAISGVRNAGLGTLVVTELT